MQIENQSHELQVKFADSDIDLARCFSVMVQLRSHLTQPEFVSRVKRQQQSGYFLVYLEQEGSIKALAGFRLLEMLAHGKILYVDDLITDAEERSKGYGGALFDWLVNYAKAQNCDAVQLDSGVQRTEAHRFYFSKRMHISSFHFYLQLEQN
ncbi:MAG TPA: GNAT family N-acetyltransferase [Waterburya sp.]|jgi:GNAT superfamily N-acetyltransferase